MRALLIISFSLIIIKASALSTCGIRPQGSDIDHFRIVGGHPAKPGSWPWQISMQFKDMLGFNLCSGSLINDRWIISAGHCYRDDKDPKLWTVRLGAYNMTLNETTVVELDIEKIIMHPKFTMDPRAQFDISLIKINQSLDLNGTHRHLTPVCIPSHLPADFNKLKCTITGWGYLKSDGSASDVILEASVPIVDTAKCYEKFGGGKIIVENTICAGGLEEGGVGTCKGDSGGPLQCKLDDHLWYQFGITSWGKRCAQPGWPDVFTNVAHFYEWIQDTIKHN